MLIKSICWRRRPQIGCLATGGVCGTGCDCCVRGMWQIPSPVVYSVATRIDTLAFSHGHFRVAPIGWAAAVSQPFFARLVRMSHAFVIGASDSFFSLLPLLRIRFRRDLSKIVTELGRLKIDYSTGQFSRAGKLCRLLGCCRWCSTWTNSRLDF